MLAPPKPPSAEPEALIPEARERQRRRRLVAAGSVAAAAGLVLLVHALVAGPGTKRNAADSGVGTPACRASQLSATFTPGGSAGTSLGGMMIHNSGGAACSLPVGRPAVQVIFRGKPLATTESGWGNEEFGKPAGHIVPVGTKAFVEIGWGDLICPNPYTAPTGRNASLSVRFRDGLRLSVPYSGIDGGVSLPACGEAMNPPPRILVSPLLLLHR